MSQSVRLNGSPELNPCASGSGPGNPALHSCSVAAEDDLRLALWKPVADHQRAMCGQIAHSHRNASASLLDRRRQYDVGAR